LGDIQILVFSVDNPTNPWYKYIIPAIGDSFDYGNGPRYQGGR